MASKERTRKYREKLNADPIKREEVLRKRREKYQEKKRNGEIKPFKVTSLPPSKIKKLRELWRTAQRTYRKKRKNLQPEADTSDDDEEYTKGQFVIVKYEEKPYVGQIVDIINQNELKVNCIEQQGTRNAFVWPQRQDCICYNRTEIVCSLEQPEQCKRFVRLLKCDWLTFNGV